MATTVNETPTAGLLSPQRIAQPVCFGVGSTWIDGINFLLGRGAKHVVCSNSRLPHANTTQNFRYYRSPGAVLLLVCVIPWNGTAETASLTIACTITGASTVGTTRLDGSTIIMCTSANVRAPSAEWKLLDVSGLTVGTAYELTVTGTASGSGSQGVEHVSAFEIHRDMLNCGAAPGTDPGVNAIFPAPGNDIYAGTASTTADMGGGTERVIGQLNSIKTSCRNFVLNVTWGEDTTNAISTVSATYAAFTGAASARWYCQPRRWFTTATANIVTVRIRYLSAAADLVFRLNTTPVGGATTNNEITCPASGTWATATGSATIATSGTNGEAYIELEGKVASGTAYVGGVSAADNEV